MKQLVIVHRRIAHNTVTDTTTNSTYSSQQLCSIRSKLFQPWSEGDGAGNAPNLGKMLRFHKKLHVI